MPIRRLYKSERFLRIIFGASLFVVLCMGGLAYKYIHDLSESFEMVQHTYEAHIELQKTLSILRNAETGQRGFLISKDSIFLEYYAAGDDALNQNLLRLKVLTSDNPEQKKNYEELKVKIANRTETLKKTLQLAKQGKIDTPEFVTALKEGRQQMNAVHFEINEMINHENGMMNVRKEKSKESFSNAPLLVYYVLILSLALLLLIYAQISKNLLSLRIKNEELEIFKESTMQSEIVSKHANWIWHVNDNTYKYSDNLYRLLGELPQSFEATLDNFLAFVHPEDLQKFKKEIDQMMVDEDLPFIYYRILQKNGSIKHFKAYGNVLINTTGERRLLGTIVDITDEIEIYSLIEERNLELERNNKELESFNYVASHDLQEPLRKIQTFISRLEDTESEKLSDNGQLYFSRIKVASERMRALIDDLLQFSRTNKSEEAFEVSNMNVLLQSAKDDLTETINDKKAKITADLLPPMSVIPFQIKQLFQNLISNSLKYSHDMKVPVIHITYSKTKVVEIPQIKSTKYKNYHTITIKDNGIGFDQDYAEKIFILFNRLHGKNEYSGTGIGLSICKKIVENHQGHIFASSIKNQGAVFTIYLPFI